jgi:hypothetical protein
LQLLILVAFALTLDILRNHPPAHTPKAGASFEVLNPEGKTCMICFLRAFNPPSFIPCTSVPFQGSFLKRDGTTAPIPVAEFFREIYFARRNRFALKVTGYSPKVEAS